jgi:predicted DNA-binding transcriptional regulator AlpA
MARAKAQEPDDKPPVPLLERDGMITKKELAAFLGYSEGTLDQWASRGGGPDYHIIGNHRMYLPADVKAWLATRKRRTASEPIAGAA